MKDNSSDLGMSSEEKKELKEEIFNSIRGFRVRRLLTIYASMAAAALVLICAWVLMQNNDSSEWLPAEIASVMQREENYGDDVILLLDDQERVVIEEEGSVIKYSQTGKTISINDTKSIELGTEEKVAFNTLMVPYGKRAQIALSDGSRVWLNSGSKFVYPSRFAGNVREVYLEGEGIFEVISNQEQPFLITARDHQIRVLGTVFNVSNYPDEHCITTVLKSGRVQVDYRSDDLFGRTRSIEITPGTKATYNKRSLEIETSEVRVESYFSWRDGVFVFKNDNLESIMKKLSRYYNVDIQIVSESLRSQRFSGYLDLKDDVEQVIRIIEETTSFTYSFEEKNVIILNQKTMPMN